MIIPRSYYRKKSTTCKNNHSNSKCEKCENYMNMSAQNIHFLYQKQNVCILPKYMLRKGLLSKGKSRQKPLASGMLFSQSSKRCFHLKTKNPGASWNAGFRIWTFKLKWFCIWITKISVEKSYQLPQGETRENKCGDCNPNLCSVQHRGRIEIIQVKSLVVEPVSALLVHGSSFVVLLLLSKLLLAILKQKEHF